MKRTFYTLFIIALGFSMAWSSCRKYEREPEDWFTSELTFDTLDKNGTIAGFALNNIYTYIPNGFTRINGDFLDAATDDAVPSRFNTPVENIAKGAIRADSNPEENTGNENASHWTNCYAGIRRANIFLKNIDVVPLLNAQTKVHWKSEARFLRAYFYWELLKRYGGVPLLGDSVYSLNDDLTIPRSTFAQTVDYIISECDAVKNLMRTDPVPDADWGRVSKGAALALKSRVFLYAASPLHNGGGIESDPVKKALTGYLTADNTRWQKVIDACDEFNTIKSGANNYYGLVSTGTPSAFASVFTSKKSNEIIFAKQSPNSTNLEFSQSPVGYLSNNQKSQGLTSPTQDFVDAFPMANGLAINATGSTYNAANPYAGRDPRLAVTVFYNGLGWLGRPVQTYENGLDKPNNMAVSQVQTRTGYYLRKFLGNFTTGTSYSNTSHNFPIFRFAEIILNKAEALNELNQVEMAVTEIARIRARAGVGTAPRHGIRVGITQAEMRTLIQNERRIELAFEEHRFWDVRRWKIAPDVYNKVLKGVRISNTTPLALQPINVSTLTWNNRMYHMPIPFSEITKNPSLVQNEGW